MVDAIGSLDQSLHYCFDHDFWIRSLLAGYEPLCLEESLAGFRWHRESKTLSRSHLFLEEDWIVFRRYCSRLSREEATQARQWLLEYEAEDLLNTTYRFLAAGGRWQALGHLSARLHLAPYLKPPRLILGALYRTLITGKPPSWFHRGE